jgi:rhodanese-related sulfurtransferase
LSLVAAKFVPGVSVIAPPMAGALGMPWRRFLLWDACGAFLWTGLYLALGAAFSTQIHEVLAALADAGAKAAAGIALVVTVVLLVRWLRRRAALDARDVGRIGAEELSRLLAAGQPMALVDVRGPLAQQAYAPIAGALPVGLDGLEHVAGRLSAHEVVVYCSCPHDVSAIKGARRLRELGVERVRVLVGGYDAWMGMQGPGAVDAAMSRATGNSGVSAET